MDGDARVDGVAGSSAASPTWARTVTSAPSLRVQRTPALLVLPVPVTRRHRSDAATDGGRDTLGAAAAAAMCTVLRAAELRAAYI